MVLCYTMIVLKLYCSPSPGERGGKPPQQVDVETTFPSFIFTIHLAVLTHHYQEPPNALSLLISVCLVASQEEGGEAGDCGDCRVLPLLVAPPDPHVPRHLLHRHQGIISFNVNIIVIALMLYIFHFSVHFAELA